MSETPDPPIEGQVLLVAMAKASVTGRRLSELVETAQEDLAPRVGELAGTFECVEVDGDVRYFLAPEGWWDEEGARLGLDERERDALRRAHAEQLRRLGRETGRTEEFETALEIRDAVVVRA